MSFEYVIDSSAWLEYFMGSAPGKKTMPYVEGDSAATSAMTLAELKEKYLREKWSSFDADLNFITSRTTLKAVDRQISLLAGEINHERKRLKRDWGMADSIVLATARSASAKVVTGDKHFEDLPEVILI